MAIFLDQIQKYRFVLVAVIVAGVFGAKSIWPSATEIAFTSVLSQVTAGTEISVNLTGGTNDNIHLILTDPTQNQITLTAKTNSNGKAKIVLPSENLKIAGAYKMSASYENKKNESVEANFETVAASPSALKSRVTFSQNTLDKDSNVLMNVTLKDEFENPVKGHALTVTPNKNQVSVYTAEFVTNEKGQMNFNVTGYGEGIVNFNIFDSTEGQTILGQPALALVGGGNGGSDEVMLASEGTVSSFGISGLAAETIIGETKTITVKALDSEGFTVSNYTGTIRLSSSDNEAVLPDDYTFLAQDQGEHTFSLAMRLATPGTQTVTVTDTDDTEITGSTSTKVVQSEDATKTYNEDFETTDFTRDGDFDLISPASGTYSSNTVEVQGEAEYGYTAIIYLDGAKAGGTETAFDNSFSYTLQELKDKTYEVYVEIVELDKDGEVTKVMEKSSKEEITVDTTAPELISVESDPKENIAPETEITITVLSEKGLSQVAAIFNENSYEMEETSVSGKYQTKIVTPKEVGDYALDILLSDNLGNEAEYRKELTLTVGAAQTTAPIAQGSDKVTGLTTTGDSGKVILSWEAPTLEKGIAFYRVYYGPSADSLFAVSETFDSSTTWMITDLTPNQNYFFAISAIDIEGTETGKSDTVLGVPLAKEGSSGTTIYNNQATSTDLTAHVNKTPETGPSGLILLAVSLLGALSYFSFRGGAAKTRA